MVKHRSLWCLLAVLALTVVVVSGAFAIPAFPGAEGYGRNAVGGRGGTVIQVTNLNDSGTGSLRAAVDASGARIVVFRVAGLIVLTTPLIISNPYITIAGQTAPGDGVCLKLDPDTTQADGPIQVCTHDVVIRYLRSRSGTSQNAYISVGSNIFVGAVSQSVYNVMIDHCSFSWHVGRTGISIWPCPGYSATDITIQRCLAGEALMVGGTSAAARGAFCFGTVYGCDPNAESTIDNVTMYRNLMAHHKKRHPEAKNDNQNTIATYSLVNNVIYHYNVDGMLLEGDDEGTNYHVIDTEVSHYNVIGNYFKRDEMDNSDHSEIAITPGTRVYVGDYTYGNIGPFRSSSEQDPWDSISFQNWGPTEQYYPCTKDPYQATDPFDESDIPPYITAEEAYTDVLDDVGANMALNADGTARDVSDPVDVRLINDVINNTGNFINDPSDVGGWPSYSAFPTFVAAGAVAYGTGAITPALPAGLASNDILLLFLETANEAISIANQNGGTWTEVANSPQGTGTAGASDATRLTVFWSRYNGTQGAPTTSDSGNHQIGRIIAIRGVATSGDPWDVTAGGVEATADTSGAIPGATTTVDNALVVAAIATALPDSNGTSNFSAWANGDLTNVTEQTDDTRNSGNGGGLATATGEKDTAGAYGDTTVTVGTASAKAMMSIALKPSASPAPAYTDSDNDGMADTWETAKFGNLNRNGTGDYDSDSYTDLEEFLNATNPLGGDPPVANFTGNPTSGTTPLTVNFTDTSTNTPTSWSWTFGDSGTSTSQSPSHQYTSADTYTVSLTATNAAGSDGETKTNYITVSAPQPPVANFSGNPTSGSAPLTVNFTDLSTNTPTSWSWTFGDSGTSTAQNPSHQYTSTGTYTVSLTATNAAGSDDEVKINYITVTGGTDYFCSSVTITTGNLVSGDHTSVHASDDSYLVVQSIKEGKHITRTDYTFNTGLGSLSYLKVTVEGHVGSGSSSEPQKFYLWNYSTSGWTQVGTQTMLTGSDTTEVVDNIANPGNYISSGTVKLRVQTGGWNFSQYNHYMDLVKITATS